MSFCFQFTPKPQFYFILPITFQKEHVIIQISSWNHSRVKHRTLQHHSDSETRQHKHTTFTRSFKRSALRTKDTTSELQLLVTFISSWAISHHLHHQVQIACAVRKDYMCQYMYCLIIVSPVSWTATTFGVLLRIVIENTHFILVFRLKWMLWKFQRYPPTTAKVSTDIFRYLICSFMGSNFYLNLFCSFNKSCFPKPIWQMNTRNTLVVTCW